MQISPKILLLAIPSSLGLGVYFLKGNDRLSSDVPTDSLHPTAWKIQPVEAPILTNKSAHQLLLDRQKQVSNRNLSCDCNGCRVAAAQSGVRIN